MRILFLSQWFPFPPNNGSKIRIYHLLKGLSQFHQVDLLSFYDPDERTPDPSGQYPFCSQVRLVSWKPFDPRSKKAALGLFSVKPRSLTDTHSPEMERLISEMTASGKYDLIIASQLTMASYYPVFAGLPAIFDEIELGFFIDQAYKHKSLAVRLRLRLTWFKLRVFFSRLLHSFSGCTVVSELERQNFVEYFPRHAHKIDVLRNCINVDEYQKQAFKLDPRRIVFSGSFRYNPNYRAMQWFVGEVFPLILKQIPDAQLVITGDHANLPLPQSPNVTLAGYVDDIKPVVGSSAVSLAPLWSGGGTRLKILEAMALGTPVVATSKGAEGLGARTGEQVLIADEPELFAAQVVRVLRDPALRASLSTNGLQFVKENYDWKKVMPNFLGLLEKVAAA